MLQLTINYESKWGNSFLDADNNAPLPKGGRAYCASLKSLNDKTIGEKSFKRREITTDTVMGVLNRLIGDQRKLYQSRSSDDYYFAALEREHRVTFEDRVSAESQEMVYLRNFTNSTDQSAFSGMINAAHPAFTSDFSCELWGVLFLPLESLCDFILNETQVPAVASVCPVTIAEQYDSVIGKMKNVKVEASKLPFIDKLLDAESALVSHFDVNYRNAAGTDIQIFSLYCSALYLQLERLSQTHDLSNILSRSGGLSGFSKRGFTYKDFMKAFTTGDGKIVFGNPYYRETLVKGVGKTREMLKKTSGSLIINLDIDDGQAKEIVSMMTNAGVMSFPLGKKGLAYVEKMRVV